MYPAPPVISHVMVAHPMSAPPGALDVPDARAEGGDSGHGLWAEPKITDDDRGKGQWIRR
jgi:hypothetical protein